MADSSVNQPATPALHPADSAPDLNRASELICHAKATLDLFIYMAESEDGIKILDSGTFINGMSGVVDQLERAQDALNGSATKVREVAHG